MMPAVIDGDHVMYLSALNIRSDWFFLVLNNFLTNDSPQSADRPTRKPCCGRELHV